MGNNNSRNDQGDVDPANTLDDFEPIDKPASPTFMSAFQKPFNPNDLTTSGVLVDIPEEDKQAPVEKRRSKTTSTTTSDKKDRQHHHHDVVPITQQSDDELLQESLNKDKQERLHKLQTDQKNRRNKAVEERRKSPPTPNSSSADVVQANPFSRFLSVFSVEPQFPNHKRRYEPSESEMGTNEEDDPKRPKLDPNDTPDNPSSSIQSILLDWLDTHLPPGWPWMAAAATSTAIVAFLLVSRNTKQRQQLLLPPPSSSNYKPTTIW